MDYATYDIDFTETGKRRVHLFSYVLGYSRRQYVRFVESQDMETTLREHVRAFEHRGGAAAGLPLYDNMKVVVTQHDEGGAGSYNTRFLAFATHYGFRLVGLSSAARPKRKGKVERPFQFVESSLLNGRSFRSLEHLNEVTAWWLEHVADVRVHRETKCRPLDRHAEERVHLVPLPEPHPYDTAEVVYRTVNAEGYVAYRQNFWYSVPWQHIELAAAGADHRTGTDCLRRGPAGGRPACVVAAEPDGGQEPTAGTSPGRGGGPHGWPCSRSGFAQMGLPSPAASWSGLLCSQRYGKDQACKLLAPVGLVIGVPTLAGGLGARGCGFRGLSSACRRTDPGGASSPQERPGRSGRASPHAPGSRSGGPSRFAASGGRVSTDLFSKKSTPDDGRDIPPAPPEEECPFDAP